MAARQGRPKALGNRNNNSTRRTSVPANPSKPKCFNCCKLGHVAKHCRSKPFCPLCKKDNHCLRDCRFKKKKEDLKRDNANNRNNNTNNNNSNSTNNNSNNNPNTNYSNNNTSNSNRNRNNNDNDDKKNATCANCKKKGHLAKDCSGPKTQADGKKWPRDRVSSPELTQLLNFTWSTGAITEWTELIRLCEFEVFYARQVRELNLEVQHELPTKYVFEHHFDGTKKELLLPSRNSEFNKAKLAEFRAGLNAIRLLQITTVDLFRKEVAKMCVNIIDGPMSQSLYLDSLPPQLADAVRGLDQQRNTLPRQDKLLKIKQIGEYSESKIGELTIFFSQKTKEAESDAEIQFAIKKSRQDANNTANQAQRQLTNQERQVLNLLGAAAGPQPNAPQPPPPPINVEEQQ